MQGSGTTDEATIVGGATRGGVARRMSTPVVIEIEYDGVPAGSHRSSTYGDNKRNSYGSSMYETTPLLASKRPVSLSLDALGGDFFAPEPAPSLALFTSAAAAREWAYAQWIEQRARIAQIGLIVAFAFFATLKPVLQKVRQSTAASLLERISSTRYRDACSSYLPRVSFLLSYAATVSLLSFCFDFGWFSLMGWYGLVWNHRACWVRLADRSREAYF